MSKENVVGGIEDPRFQKGLDMIHDNDFEGGINLLSELLEDTVSKFGEVDLRTGPIYYQYASAIIDKVDLSSEITSPNDVDEDLKNAWECLEAARFIYTKDDQHQAELAKVLLRLSDISFKNFGFATAIQDAQSALDIRRKLFDHNDKRIADAEHTLALDCFYCAKDKVTEYLNKKEDEEQEEEEEKPEEAEKELDAILEEAKNYMRQSVEHYKESERIYKYLACKVAVDHQLIENNLLQDEVSEETMTKLKDLLSTTMEKDFHQELEDDIEIAADLKEKVQEAEKWTVEEEMEMEMLDEEDLEELDEFEEDLEDDLEEDNNKRVMDEDEPEAKKQC